MTAATTPGLHVVRVRYEGDEPYRPAGDPTGAYAETGAYAVFGEPSLGEPTFPEAERGADPIANLGLIGGEIAAEVARGRRAGRPVLIVGGTCAVVPGVIGGLQEAHGPATRIGLAWFDAHGDFNTPHTTRSGMLGGMPVAVSAGLAHPAWREGSRLVAPLPSDRILMVDVRNLDPAEADLIHAVGIAVAAPAPGFPGADLERAVADLADRCDLIYLHVDADILDGRFMPNHPTREPNGPDIAQVLAAIDTVMRTGKVAAFALVSVWADGAGSNVALAAGIDLLRGGLDTWHRHGGPALG